MTLFRYDVLRVLATVAVVWLHVSMYAVLYDKPNSMAWWVGNVADAAVRWCVPMFVLVSGALLLGPRDESPREFYRKRLDRVMIPLLFWSAFYIGLKLAVRAVTPTEAAVSLWRGRPHYHLWYLYMALGLYLLTPFLRTFIKTTSTRTRVPIILLVLAVSICGVAVAYFAGWEGTFFTLFAPYVGYYLLGYHLAQSRLRIPTWVLWTVLLASIATTATCSGLFSAELGLYPYAYVGLPVLVMSTAIYCLGSKLPLISEGLHPFFRNTVELLAKASLGIYLMHPLLLELLERVFGLSIYCRFPLVSIPTLTMLVFTTSGAAVLILFRIPYLRRLV